MISLIFGVLGCVAAALLQSAHAQPHMKLKAHIVLPDEELLDFAATPGGDLLAVATDRHLLLYKLHYVDSYHLLSDQPAEGITSIAVGKHVLHHVVVGFDSGQVKLLEIDLENEIVTLQKEVRFLGRVLSVGVGDIGLPYVAVSSEMGVALLEMSGERATVDWGSEQQLEEGEISENRGRNLQTKEQAKDSRRIIIHAEVIFHPKLRNFFLFVHFSKKSQPSHQVYSVSGRGQGHIFIQRHEADYWDSYQELRLSFGESDRFLAQGTIETNPRTRQLWLQQLGSLSLWQAQLTNQQHLLRNIEILLFDSKLMLGPLRLSKPDALSVALSRSGDFVAATTLPNKLSLNYISPTSSSLQEMSLFLLEGVVLNPASSHIQYVYDDRLIIPTISQNEGGRQKNILQIVHFCYGAGCSNFCVSACGDGIVDPGEECDDNNTATNDDCAFCMLAKCGDGFLRNNSAIYNETCDDENTNPNDSCTEGCQVARCGDGRVWSLSTDSPEQCDDGNSINIDDCSNECLTLYCGDNIVSSLARIPEQCDDGNRNNNDSCKNNCTRAICGDGVLWPQIFGGSEQCDDGNSNNNDDCVNCIRSFCGDGFVQTVGSRVEECDDGNRVGTDGCNNLCQVNAAVCGNGIVEVSEECDDRNKLNQDECLNNCRNASCGDGVIWIGVEECDDNNSFITDSCLNDCKMARCGDAVIRVGVEECDDGNQINEDECTNLCRFAFCGDGILQTIYSQQILQQQTAYTISKQQCDDGNADSTDSCTDMCQNAYCGDGLVQAGVEQCDQGDIYGVGCTSKCKYNICGDGYLYISKEECDDGNQINDDKCSNTCSSPICGDGIVQRLLGEECDGGQLPPYENQKMVGIVSNCTDQCLLKKCGNGFLDEGEECDDGNNDTHDSCTNRCKNATCGDGIEYTENEACDDGNHRNDDGCSYNCSRVSAAYFCGNGVVDRDWGEECDDSNSTVFNRENKKCINCQLEPIVEDPRRAYAACLVFGIPILAVIVGGIAAVILGDRAGIHHLEKMREQAVARLIEYENKCHAPEHQASTTHRSR